MSLPHRRATDATLATALDELAVVMVCGSGGVGKTSIAASIAVNEAMRGRRVCVLTDRPSQATGRRHGPLEAR